MNITKNSRIVFQGGCIDKIVICSEQKEGEFVTFLDNQETKRFARIAKENMYYPPSRLKLALTYLFTSPGIPNFYYGTEIALDGGMFRIIEG